jgi:hypothetical protein
MTTPTPPPLAEIGEALYGDRWQRSMARALGVSERTVRYWAAGHHPVPISLSPQLVGLARDRRAQLQRLIEAFTLGHRPVGGA